MTVIPNPPTQGDEFTNDVTGVKYRYDGSKWVVISTPESEDIVELTQRVADGETVQAQIQETISDALEVQERTLKKDESNVVTPAFRIRSDTKTFISTASGDLGLYNVADPTNPAHALNLGYADDRYLQPTDVNGSFLPLSGGGMTGDINMMNCRFDTFNADGDKTMEIAPSGFIKSRDMLRVVRDDGGPALEARSSDSSDDITLKLDTTGNYMFTGIGDLRNDVRVRNQKSFIVRGSNNTNVGRFRALNDSQCILSAEDGKTLFISNLASPFLSTDAATKGYVDQVAAPFVTSDEVDTRINNETVHLPLTGGTLTGGLGINMPAAGANGFAFSRGNNTNFTMKFQTDTEARMIVQSGKVFKLNSFVGGVQTNVLTIGTGGNLSLYNLRTPTNPTDAATMAYVDEAVAEAAEPDLSGYLRKSEFYHYNRAPAVLSWKFDSTSTGSSAPADEYFKITDNGGDKYFRLSFKTANGADLGDAAFSDTNVSIDNGPVGTVWYWNYEVEKWRLKEQFRINTWRWNYNGHFEFRTSSRHGSKNYTSGTSYYITVGGFF